MTTKNGSAGVTHVILNYDSGYSNQDKYGCDASRKRHGQFSASSEQFPDPLVSAISPFLLMETGELGFSRAGWCRKSQKIPCRFTQTRESESREPFAVDCPHSHLVTGFLSLGESPFDTPRRSPEISHQLASVPRRQSPRDMCLRVEWGPLALSLYRPVSGVTV